MNSILKKYNSIDWDIVIERLNNKKGVKLYFDGSFETLMICGVENYILVKNNIPGEIVIHNPSQYATEFNADSLKILIEDNLYANDIENIVIVEEIEFELTLVDIFEVDED